MSGVDTAGPVSISLSAIHFSDVPLDALREAKAHVGGGALGGRTDVVAADGRWLPFRAASFDAIVHADVLC